MFFKGGLRVFSCGEIFLNPLGAKSQHPGGQLAGKGQLATMPVKPVGGDGKDLRGFLCVQEAVSLMVAILVCRSDLLAYQRPQPGFQG